MNNCLVIQLAVSINIPITIYLISLDNDLFMKGPVLKSFMRQVPIIKIFIREQPKLVKKLREDYS